MLVFLMGIGVCLAPWEFMMWRSGECLPTEWVVEQQIHDPELVTGRAVFTYQGSLYKYLSLQKRAPSIWVIGSSRAMQFRSMMFNPFEKDFYNAGGIFHNLLDLEFFARKFKEGELTPPRMILLTIDPWWLKQSAHKESSRLAKLHSENGRLYPALRDQFFAFRDYLEKPVVSLRVFNLFDSLRMRQYPYNASGLRPILTGDGFRYDGSRLYAKNIQSFIKQPKYQEVRGFNQEAAEEKGRFKPTEGLSSQYLERLLKSIRVFASQRIEIHTLFPPVSNEIQTILKKADSRNSESRHWWFECTDTAAKKIREEGIPCKVVSSPADFGLDDRVMIDGIHPSEVFVAHILKDLINQSPEDSILHQINATNIDALLQRQETIPVSFMFEGVETFSL